MRLISIGSFTSKLGLVAVLGCGVDEGQLLMDQAEIASGIAIQEQISAEELSGLDKFIWSEPVNLGAPVNTSAIEIMPTLSQDERSLYFVSNRDGGLGGTDIWVSRRKSIDGPWETPVNLGADVNTLGNEADPALSSDGRRLFFSSNRPGGHRGLDIYVSHRRDPNDDLGWGPPLNLGPLVNTMVGERSADYTAGAPNTPALLYFTRGQGLIQSEIYAAPITTSGEVLAPAETVGELNAPGSVTVGQSLRMGAKEIYFMSNRGGSDLDIWISSRGSRHEAWSTPINAGAPLNTRFAEERPDLSFDGRTLLFDSDRPHADGAEDQDIWMSTRVRWEE